MVIGNILQMINNENCLIWLLIATYITAAEPICRKYTSRYTYPRPYTLANSLSPLGVLLHPRKKKRCRASSAA